MCLLLNRQHSLKHQFVWGYIFIFMFNLFSNLISVFWSSAETRRANPSQRLLSRSNIQGTARKKYTTSSLNDQINLNRLKSSKQHKKLGITGPCSTYTFFLGKQLFYWVRVRSDNAEDDDIILLNSLGEPFCCILHCSERNEFFRSNFLFHGQNIRLELVVMDYALDKSFLGNNQSLSFTFLHSTVYTHSPFKWRI